MNIRLEDATFPRFNVTSGINHAQFLSSIWIQIRIQIMTSLYTSNVSCMHDVIFHSCPQTLSQLSWLWVFRESLPLSQIQGPYSSTSRRKDYYSTQIVVCRQRQTVLRVLVFAPSTLHTGAPQPALYPSLSALPSFRRHFAVTPKTNALYLIVQGSFVIKWYGIRLNGKKKKKGTSHVT